jgi:hypothetical protein
MSEQSTLLRPNQQHLIQIDHVPNVNTRYLICHNEIVLRRTNDQRGEEAERRSGRKKLRWRINEKEKNESRKYYTQKRNSP